MSLPRSFPQCAFSLLVVSMLYPAWAYGQRPDSYDDANYIANSVHHSVSTQRRQINRLHEESEDGHFKIVSLLASSGRVDPEVSRAAFERLSKVQDERAVGSLVDIVRSQVQDSVRIAAVEALRPQMLSGEMSLKVADALHEFSEDGSLSQGVRDSATNALSSLAASAEVQVLVALKKAKSPRIRDVVQRELERLETLESRLPPQDVRRLERVREKELDRLQARLKDDEDVLARQRKRGARRNEFPTNPYYERTVVQKRVAAKKKHIAALKKRPLFDYGVDLLATYCEATAKAGAFADLALSSGNLADTAAKLPVIRYQTDVTAFVNGMPTVVDQKTEEFDPSVFAGVAAVFAGGMTVEANEARRLAEELQRYLNGISDDGLLKIKEAYLERLVEEGKKKVRR